MSITKLIRFFPTSTDYAVVWLVACIGLVLSGAGVWVIHQQLKSRELLEFEWVAKNRIRAIQHGIDSGLESVTVIRDLYTVSNNVSEQDFRELAESLLRRYGGIQGLKWVPLVRRDNRPQFEQAARSTHTEFQVSEMSPEGKIVPAEVRDTYFPVLFAIPSEGNEVSIGFDMNSDPVLREALIQARDSGDMAVSGAIRLVQETGDQFGFAALLPVYTRGAAINSITERRENLLGFAVGVFRIGDLITASVGMLEPRGVDVLVEDKSTTGTPRFMYFYTSRLGTERPHQSMTAATSSQTDELQLSQSISVADRVWLITALRTPRFISAEAFRESPWVVLVVGALFTALISLYLAKTKDNMRERLEMETALKEREELFRQMTETVDEVFWAATPDTRRLLYLSPAYEKIWGVTGARLGERPTAFFNAVPAEDQDRLIANLDRIRKDNETVEVVHRVLRDDGVLRWVRTRGFPITDKSGKVYRVVGFMEDITERKLADEALRESEEQLRAMFNQSPDIIMTITCDGLIKMINRSIPEIPKEAVIDRNALALVPSSHRKSLKRMLKQALVEGTIQQFQLSTADLRWWEGRIVPLGVGESITSMMVIATDVTEKRNLQMQAMRSARLASVGVLAAGVAHEINNPNNSIQFNASLLARMWNDITPILEEYHRENGDFSVAGLSYAEASNTMPKLIEGMTQNSQRIQKIVENLKYMSKQDAGKIDGIVDIQKVLEATMMVLHNQVQKYTDVCNLNISSDLPEIRGNSQQLEQVFINIIVNALHSLPDRNHSVSIATAVDKSAATLNVSVTDQGVGISEEDLERIVEPFFTLKADGEGTGLGLSISKSIVENHGGTMRFESELGKGTTVTVSLPLVQALQVA